jgi:predicted metal-dependent enzyme (double-stranded beta helix superfamily)
MTDLDRFAAHMQALVNRQPPISDLLQEGSQLLGDVIKKPGVVPPEFRVTSEKRLNHGTYNVYRGDRVFISVSVWGPGDRIDPHNHGTWGLIGVVENAIQETRYRVIGMDDQGCPMIERTYARLLNQGDISILRPEADEIHELDNFSQHNTVELHVYGKNLIGLDRYAFDRTSGGARLFKSEKYDNC